MPRTESIIEVSDGVSLHTIISIPGKPTSRPTLLLIHFWGGSNRTSLITYLEDQFNIIAPSLRGWGESAKPSDPEIYTISNHMSDISGLIRHLEASEPDLLSNGIILCGHSMGGKIAQVYLGVTELIKGVVLLAPAPSGRFALPDDMREQQIHAYDTVGSAKFVIKNVLLGKPDSVGDATLEILVSDAVRGAAEAKAAWPLYGMAEDHEKAVIAAVANFAQSGQKLRVLVVVGELDRVETAETVEMRVSRLLSNAGASVRTIVLEGVGHLSPMEAPEQIAQAVFGFTDAP